MKQKLTVIFLILMCFAVLFAVNVQAETTITDATTGTHCGYNKVAVKLK